jgi:hypothetical protein
MKIWNKLLLLSLLSLITLFSCKKDGPTVLENKLVGNWKELDVNRSLKFTIDNFFAFSITDGDGVKSTYSGNYQINGDNFNVSTQKVLVQQPGKLAQTTPSTTPFFDKASFSVSGDTLTINYISYPADAPVPTTGKFLRSAL